jgi:hypothetical protein
MLFQIQSLHTEWFGGNYHEWRNCMKLAVAFQGIVVVFTARSVSEDGRYPGTDSNWRPPEYKCGKCSLKNCCHGDVATVNEKYKMETCSGAGWRPEEERKIVVRGVIQSHGEDQATLVFRGFPQSFQVKANTLEEGHVSDTIPIIFIIYTSLVIYTWNIPLHNPSGNII